MCQVEESRIFVEKKKLKIEKKSEKKLLIKCFADACLLISHTDETTYLKRK